MCRSMLEQLPCYIFLLIIMMVEISAELTMNPIIYNLTVTQYYVVTID